MRDHLFDMHNAGVFVMEIEEIDLMADERAIVGAFLDDDAVECIGVSIDRARTHATGGALAADDEALDAALAQMCNQRGAEEGGGALLVDDEIARHGRKLLLDAVELLGFAWHSAVGLAHAAGVRMPGGIDDRNAGGPGGGEELPRRFQRPPRMLAAGAGIAPIDFANRAVAALIGLVIEIDRQHRGT